MLYITGKPANRDFLFTSLVRDFCGISWTHIFKDGVFVAGFFVSVYLNDNSVNTVMLK